MFSRKVGISSVASVYNWNRHVSVRGGLSGGLSETIQNNASVVSRFNSIAISISQVHFLALGLFWCPKTKNADYQMGWL